MTFEEYISEIAGEDYVLVTDSESIDQADDYEGLIEDLFSLTDGELILDSFESEEDDELILKLVVNGKRFTINLDDHDGWIDWRNLIYGLNEILSSSKSKRRFYGFWDGESFRQEIGFFFAGQNTGMQIIEYARDENESVMEASELLQISDGTEEEGFQDL